MRLAHPGPAVAVAAAQQQVVAEINARYLGQTVDVLFEEKRKGKWRGRTQQNKLVFVESDRDLLGKLENVEITWTGPWSMQGRLPEDTPQPASAEIITVTSAR